MDKTSADKAGASARVGVLMPPEMALACEAAGHSKAGRDAVALLVLGILAGAFIALGALFMIVVMTGAAEMPWGVARLLGGLSLPAIP
jgi:formate transporter